MAGCAGPAMSQTWAWMSGQGRGLHSRTAGDVWRHLGQSPCFLISRRQAKLPSSQPPSFLAKGPVYVSGQEPIGPSCRTSPQRRGQGLQSTVCCMAWTHLAYVSTFGTAELPCLTFRLRPSKCLKVEVEANWEFKLIQLEKLREDTYSLVTASKNLSSSLWVVPELLTAREPSQRCY